MNNLEIAEEYHLLLREIEKEFHGNIKADQAIAIMTKRKNMYCIISKYEQAWAKDPENDLIQKLIQTKDSAIEYIVCKWKSYGVDVPSWNFRKKLLEADQSNWDAKLLLQGFDGYIIKKMKDVMPK